MPLSIRSEEAEAPASEPARLSGKADAVTEAIRERLEQVHLDRAKDRVTADELDKVALHCAALPVLDQRSAHKIVGYGANGLPG